MSVHTGETHDRLIAHLVDVSEALVETLHDVPVGQEVIPLVYSQPDPYGLVVWSDKADYDPEAEVDQLLAGKPEVASLSLRGKSEVPGLFWWWTAGVGRGLDHVHWTITTTDGWRPLSPEEVEEIPMGVEISGNALATALEDGLPLKWLEA